MRFALLLGATAAVASFAPPALRGAQQSQPQQACAAARRESGSLTGVIRSNGSGCDRAGKMTCVLANPPPTTKAVVEIERVLEKSRDIRCPFWRRRAADALESLLQVAKFIAARHKSLELLPPELAAALPGSACAEAAPKTRGLSREAVMQIVEADFREGQYYVSGKLSPEIYSDECFFDAPDPDLPVRSLKRYSDALSGLFDPERSEIELVRLEPSADSERAFIAHWRLSGHLKLPWRPAIKPYAGATLYEMDDDGLISSHTEAWSITAFDAFASTLFPSFGADAAPRVSEHRFVEPPRPARSSS